MRLRLGIVGVGRTEALHLAACLREPAIELRALVDSDQLVRQRVVSQGIPVHADVRALPGKVEAAIIAVPSTRHAGLVANTSVQVRWQKRRKCRTDLPAGRQVCDVMHQKDEGAGFRGAWGGKKVDLRGMTRENRENRGQPPNLFGAQLAPLNLNEY